MLSFLFLSYTLFPLLLLLDAAVECRMEKKADSEGSLGNGAPMRAREISDSVAEGVLICLEELLKKPSGVCESGVCSILLSFVYNSDKHSVFLNLGENC